VFCGYCAERPPAGAGVAPPRSRVCTYCSMGLLLAAAPNAAPAVEEPFVVVDDLMRVQALSRSSEQSLYLVESAVIGINVSVLLTPAHGLDAGSAALTALLARVLYSSGDVPTPPIALQLRAATSVRFRARIGPCRPGPAAIIVLGAPVDVSRLSV
jgi:hypothetical protein